MNHKTSLFYNQESRPSDKNYGHFLSGPLVSQNSEFHLPLSTKLLDRFELNKHVANGKGSIIYMAQDLLGTTEVALKIIDAGPLSAEWKTSQLQREIKFNRMISDFDHVIRVFDIHAVPFGGTILLFLSMEYADGGSLREWLDENQEYPQHRRSVGLNYFLQICQGLSHIHDVGLTHLDLKPENVLFFKGVLKISNLGSTIVPKLFEKATQYSKKGGLCDCGTPTYMSPELFIGSQPYDVDARSDIYSLGIILYEMLHPKCRPPFNGSYRRLRELHLEAPVPNIPETEKKLVDIIARCLEKDRAKRFQTIDELIDIIAGELPIGFKPKKSKKIESNKNIGLLKETWEVASRYYADGKLNDAAVLTDEVLKAQPSHTLARRLNEEISHRFAQAEGFYQEISVSSEGFLSESIELLAEAICIYPDHPSGALVQAKLAFRVKQYRLAMEEGLNTLQQGHWETALVWYRKAFQLHPETPHLSKIIENLNQIINSRHEIDTAVQRGNFDTALSLARYVDVCVEEMKERIPALRGSKVYEDT